MIEVVQTRTFEAYVTYVVFLVNSAFQYFDRWRDAGKVALDELIITVNLFCRLLLESWFLSKTMVISLTSQVEIWTIKLGEIIHYCV